LGSSPAFFTRWYLSLCSVVNLHSALCTLHSVPTSLAAAPAHLILPIRRLLACHPTHLLSTCQPANLPTCHPAICRPLHPAYQPRSPSQSDTPSASSSHPPPHSPCHPRQPSACACAISKTLSPPRSFTHSRLSARHCTPFLPWASSKNSRLVRRPAALLTPHSPLTPAKGLELYRLEQRYTRREKRSTFISDAQYVDGEYIYASDPLSPKTSSTGNSRRFSKMPSMPAVRIKELARVGTSRS
jgi:hypothetical protein